MTVAAHVVLVPLPEQFVSWAAIFLPDDAHPLFPLLTGEACSSIGWRWPQQPATWSPSSCGHFSILSIPPVSSCDRVDVNLDRELRVHGIANIASAFAGGFVGHISVAGR
jgi:hypothetical protein